MFFQYPSSEDLLLHYSQQRLNQPCDNLATQLTMPFSPGDAALMPRPLRLGRLEEYDLVEVPLDTHVAGARSHSPRPHVETASSAGSFDVRARNASEELTTQSNTSDKGAWAHVGAYWPAYLLAASLAGGVGTLAWQVATNSDMRAIDEEGSWLPRRHARHWRALGADTESEVAENARPLSLVSSQEKTSTMGAVPPQELESIIARATK